METVQQHLIIITIALSFLASLPLFPAYTTPDHYFLNCGSSLNAPVDSRTFVGDDATTDSSGFKVLSSNTDTVSVVDAAANKLDARYQTARVFSNVSCYRFNTPQQGTYIVRLHFYSPPRTELSSARFNVSASGHLLITNFNATEEDAVNKPVIKEFLLKIRSTHFQIYFYPEASSSSSSSSSSSNNQNKAFVNAIEVFLTPLDLTQNFNSTLFTSSGGAQQSKYNSKGFSFGSPDDKILIPIYRITVGGQQPLLPSDPQSTLWRNWSTDDSFLLNATSTTDNTNPVSINFSDVDDDDDVNGIRLATTYDAPYPVYRYARSLSKKVNQDKPVATWRFRARKKSIYFLRAHFCDVLEQGNGAVEFILYINAQFAKIIDPNLNGSASMAVPFYYDFLVESDPSGFVNVSIGPWSGARIQSGNAFLNGLEIMEVVNSSSTSVKEPYIPEPPPPSENHTSVTVIIIIIAGSVGGGVLAFIMITAAVCGRRRRRYFRSKRPKPTTFEAFDWPLDELNGIIVGGGAGESLDGSKQESTRRSGGSSGSPFNLHLKLRIPFSEIKNVTNNFDDLLVIGQGGFGKVYKGTLRNGKKVAVKRSDPDSRHGQGFAEFQAEINVLCRIRHRHLVSLIGYCNDHHEMILVYEFMEKGTLKDHLYGARVPSSATSGDKNNGTGNKGMPWKQRLEICIGAAEGLHYLHMGASSTRGIIHRDVKSTNILLDQNYVAKVSDFGLSRLYNLDMQNDTVSTEVKGTPGYLDPEYYNYFVLTEKSDVYSFGIVLLEVLCARPVIGRSLPEDQVNLADWAMKCEEEGELEKIVDPLLVEKINSSSMKKFMETIKNCLRDCGADRPPMKDVLWDLKYALQLDSFAGGSRGNGGLYGDTTTTMDGNSLNMAVLATSYNESASFPSPPNEEDEDYEDQKPPNEEDEDHEDQVDERPWLKNKCDSSI